MTGEGAPRAECLADGILFDMDGTLVDSTAVVEAAWARFADRFGLRVADILAYSHGRLTIDTVRRFLPAGHDVEAVVRDMQQWELVRTDGIVEVPGAAALLRALSGARVAVVTSAPRELALRRLAAAGIEVPAVVVAAEDVAAGKPDPSGYLQGARALGVSAERCIAFEDADAGLRAALASGARTVVVGAFDSETARGLDRVPDFCDVRARVEPDGGVRLSWGRRPA